MLVAACFFFFVIGLRSAFWRRILLTKGDKMDMQELVKKHIKFTSQGDFIRSVKTLKARYNLSDSEAEAFANSNEMEHIKLMKSKFTHKQSSAKRQGIKFGFKDFQEFYYWYEAQGDRCYYCNTEFALLKKVFAKELLDSKKFNSTPHIERKDSNAGYSVDNCVLTCSLCNNAKSDMINAENFKNYFGKAIGKFVADLYSDVITNK